MRAIRGPHFLVRGKLRNDFKTGKGTSSTRANKARIKTTALQRLGQPNASRWRLPHPSRFPTGGHHKRRPYSFSVVAAINPRPEKLGIKLPAWETFNEDGNVEVFWRPLVEPRDERGSLRRGGAWVGQPLSLVLPSPGQKSQRMVTKFLGLRLYCDWFRIRQKRSKVFAPIPRCPSSISARRNPTVASIPARAMPEPRTWGFQNMHLLDGDCAFAIQLCSLLFSRICLF